MPNKSSEDENIYCTPRRIAFVVKVYSQMCVGFVIFVCLLFKLAILFSSLFISISIAVRPIEEAIHFLSRPTLELVGQGLAISAGIELAYMLFTPGPDEAIEPVILGLAASTLIIASDGKSDLKDYIVIPIYILTMGLLFVYKNRFVEK